MSESKREQFCGCKLTQDCKKLEQMLACLDADIEFGRAFADYDSGYVMDLIGDTACILKNVQAMVCELKKQVKDQEVRLQKVEKG